ncbi:MAG: PIN domain nuclease [Phenylobacterium zucineum]|nr:MAG: PIN domain nuclease [Phenylobacterium zucineum]
MNLLLDTHLLLWAATSGLPAKTKTLVTDTENAVYFSAASIWEVAIKASLGRDDFQADPHILRRGLLENGYLEVPITSDHAAAVSTLPNLHKDPFDRILVAQAQCEGLVLLTADTMVAAYPGPIEFVSG